MDGSDCFRQSEGGPREDAVQVSKSGLEFIYSSGSFIMFYTGLSSVSLVVLLKLVSLVNMRMFRSFSAA